MTRIAHTRPGSHADTRAAAAGGFTRRIARLGLAGPAFAALALAASALAPASAQTLEESLAAAYRTNPVLAAERARQRQTDETFVQARAARLPTVSAGANLTEEVESWGGGQIFSQPGIVSYQVNANQTLFAGGRISGQIDAARARVEAGRQTLRATEQEVLLTAVRAHLDVVRDRQVVEIRRNNTEVLARQLEAARDRFEVGEITRTDVAQAEARLSGAQAQLSAAQAQLAASRAAYERVVGAVPTAPEGPDGLPPLPEALAPAAEAALDANPTLIAARFQEAAAREGVQVARGALLPEVGLTASASEFRESDFSGKGRGEATVGARLSIPIFTGGLNGSRVREALAAEDQARLQVANTRRQVLEGVTNAWNNFVAAQAVIESSREAVRANEIAFEGVEQEAFVGLRTTLDVLNAEQELLNSRLDLVTAERDLFVAGYALLQAMGRLDVQGLALPVESYDPEANFREVTSPNLDLTPWD